MGNLVAERTKNAKKIGWKWEDRRQEICDFGISISKISEFGILKILELWNVENSEARKAKNSKEKDRK